MTGARARESGAARFGGNWVERARLLVQYANIDGVVTVDMTAELAEPCVLGQFIAGHEWCAVEFVDVDAGEERLVECLAGRRSGRRDTPDSRQMQ